MAVNYLLCWFMKDRKWVLAAGVLFDLAVLGYFKYADFLLTV